MEIEVINESKTTETKAKHLDSAIVNGHVNAFFEFLKEALKDAKKYFNEEIRPVVKDWADFAKEAVTIKVVSKEYEFLNLDELISIVKENKPDDCDGNILYRDIRKDGSITLLATYMKDGKILPAERNVNVFIISEGISKDVKNLFGDSDIIILK